MRPSCDPQARYKPCDWEGIRLFPGAELLDHSFGHSGGDLAFVGVIDGEGYQNDPGAVGQLDPVSWRVTF